jgi:hypothetical protein
LLANCLIISSNSTVVENVGFHVSSESNNEPKKEA